MRVPRQRILHPGDRRPVLRIGVPPKIHVVHHQHPTGCQRADGQVQAGPLPGYRVGEDQVEPGVPGELGQYRLGVGRDDLDPRWPAGCPYRCGQRGIDLDRGQRDVAPVAEAGGQPGGAYARARAQLQDAAPGPYRRRQRAPG